VTNPPAGVIESDFVDLPRHDGALDPMLAKPTNDAADRTNADPVEFITKAGKRRIGVIAHRGADDSMPLAPEFLRNDDRVASPTGQQANGLRQSRMFDSVWHDTRC
jgi:hypothetical protein